MGCRCFSGSQCKVPRFGSRAVAFALCWIALCGFAQTPAGTGKALLQIPELGRAAEMAALEEPGTLPFHLVGKFEATTNAGRRIAGSIEEDWYTDRWSHQRIEMGGMRAEQWMLDGRRYQDNEKFAYPFALRRLLRALYTPFTGITVPKQGSAFAETEAGGERLRCVVLRRQPPPEDGLQAIDRTFCLLRETGSLRLEEDSYGIRTSFTGLHALGRRRVPTRIELTQHRTVYAHLELTELRVAPELQPESFSLLPEARQRLNQIQPRITLYATPMQMQHEVVTVSVQMLPVDPDHMPKGSRYAIARVLIGLDGRLSDLELLWESDPETAGRSAKVLGRTSFARREVEGRPVFVEGLITLAIPYVLMQRSGPP